MAASLLPLRPAPEADCKHSCSLSPIGFRLRPTLVELCVPLLSKHPRILPLLRSIPPPTRAQIIAQLPLDLPLHLAAQFIIDEEYWKRRAMLRWTTCDPFRHGRSCKQLFFERNLADALESFDPTLKYEIELNALLDMSVPFVHNLVVRQLPSHLNPAVIFRPLESYLHNSQLTSLRLEYGWKNVKMNYDRTKFGMKISDCLAFSASLSIATVLTDLDLSFNFLDDEKAKILLKGIMENPVLLQLNLSHNQIGDSGVTELANYMVSENCVLVGLSLGDNYFSAEGSKTLAEAIKKNGILASIDLEYNRLKDEGGRAIVDSLLINTSLQKVIIGSCQLGEDTATSLRKLFSSSRPPLQYLDISGNPLIGVQGGTSIHQGLEGGNAPSYMDFQLCGIDNALEQQITELMKTKNALSKA